MGVESIVFTVLPTLNEEGIIHNLYSPGDGNLVGYLGFWSNTEVRSGCREISSEAAIVRMIFAL